MVTEKATGLAAAKQPVYTFVVSPTATKSEVKKAVAAKYGVKPLKVAMINLPRKKVRSRRRVGMRSGRRKALVYLPAGSNLNLS